MMNMSLLQQGIDNSAATAFIRTPIYFAHEMLYPVVALIV